jgi:large subunit ribosomal protein L32
MAVPKRKTSKSRRDRRRQQHGYTAVASATCPNCGAPTLSHRVCKTCGVYRGRQIIAPAAV